MFPSPVTRRSAVALLGLVGLSLPGMLEAQQPHMRAALDALRTARRHLELAEADKGGHRVKALELVTNAITETEAGIAYAASH